jgi:hypothetical protein
MLYLGWLLILLLTIALYKPTHALGLSDDQYGWVFWAMIAAWTAFCLRLMLVGPPEFLYRARGKAAPRTASRAKSDAPRGEESTTNPTLH